ncbi:hypothetical protein GCM10023322_07460 [Rugosimonospora acidiphila]|uniref:Fibronectin type-III domain-containing protein n=1 Tax=Rugosimonospora acidiphila TaxID=556531 RepID=A0ABP9RKB7_9ACTN
MAAALAVSLILTGAVVGPRAAHAEDDVPPTTGGCANMAVPEENHAAIRLRVDQPAADAQLPVDDHGNITVDGILHKHATMVDVSDGPTATNDFTIGPPPDGVPAFASSWTTTMRPPHLGANQLCVRAKRDPKRTARILRSFSVVDLIPPSDVHDLAIGHITSTTAVASWGEATDNYGLAGYEISVDGGAPQRTTVGTRSYTIRDLSPSTDHTVSVVAIDLAGNRSTTAATASFRTAEPPPPPNGDLSFDPEQGAAGATWKPDLPTEANYRVFLNGQQLAEFPVDQYCQDAGGNPASPCTEQDVVNYTIAPLEEGTPYTFRVDTLHADGTLARTLSGSFTTTTSTPTVPDAVVQQIATESSQCAGMGGSFYISPSQRGRVPLPAGSTPLFAGCYTVANHSCLDAFLPPSGDKLLDCADDVTRLLLSLAPAGHGPVISSVDGLVDYGAQPATAAPRVAPTDLLDESVTWCTEHTACTVVVEAAVEVAAETAIEAVAAASVSWIVVLGGGIVLGVALAAVLEALFPTPIGFGGLIEYPIHFDTDFDTFDNWGAGQGKWIDSLKTYAEVIKTTNELAAQRGLPFSWNSTEDNRLKETIDLACGAQAGRPPNVGNVCGNGFAIYVPGGQNYLGKSMKDTGTHIVEALGNGIPNPPARSAWFYPARSVNGQAAMNPPWNYRPGWYDTAAFKPNVCSTRNPSLQTCDEFPFWSTNQAVNLSGQLADIRPVPGAETRPQANDVIGFYNKCKVKDNERFLILPVPSWVAAGGPSFGFRVDQGAASLCMP